MAAIVAGRFLFRPALLPLAKRYGLKPLLIVGTLGVALQYPLLAEVQGVGGALLALCIVSALGEIFYWPSYHAYFAAIGDAEHRGHQLGAREALTATVNVVAPLLGAWALVTLGPRWMFAATGLIQAAAVIPLLGAPNVAVKQHAPGAFQAARLSAVIIAADGWFDACFIFVWQIALFVSLGESIPAYGGAMALAGLVGAVCGLLLGRHIDAGHGRRAVIIASVMATILVLLRAASLGSPWLAVSPMRSVRCCGRCSSRQWERRRTIWQSPPPALSASIWRPRAAGTSDASPAASSRLRCRHRALRWRSAILLAPAGHRCRNGAAVALLCAAGMARGASPISRRRMLGR